MTYATKTRSNTPPGRYHVRQTLRDWNTDKKQTDDRSQIMPCPEVLAKDHSPAHAIGGVNHMPIPSSVVDCAVGFSCLDLQSTAPPKVTHSPAGASLIPVRSLSVLIISCGVSVEIGDASSWRCWLPLDKRSGSVDHHFPFECRGSWPVVWWRMVA